MEKISWIGRVKYEILHGIEEERNVLYSIIRRKANLVG
jgi:hypothetical protein